MPLLMYHSTTCMCFAHNVTVLYLSMPFFVCLFVCLFVCFCFVFLLVTFHRANFRGSTFCQKFVALAAPIFYTFRRACTYCNNFDYKCNNSYCQYIISSFHVFSPSFFMCNTILTYKYFSACFVSILLKLQDRT